VERNIVTNVSLRSQRGLWERDVNIVTNVSLRSQRGLWERGVKEHSTCGDDLPRRVLSCFSIILTTNY
jgi:hypothetical protein